MSLIILKALRIACRTWGLGERDMWRPGRLAHRARSVGRGQDIPF